MNKNLQNKLNLIKKVNKNIKLNEHSSRNNSIKSKPIQPKFNQTKSVQSKIIQKKLNIPKSIHNKKSLKIINLIKCILLVISIMMK